jgi:SAM-dependent methyltransferase
MASTSKESWQPTIYVSDGADEWRPNWQYVNPGSRWVVGVHITTLAPLIRKHASGRLLDCGCGYAPYYGIYEPVVDEAVWIDWGETEHRNRLLDAEVDLNGPLPFPDASFDSVLLTDVLEHIAAPESLIQEIARILRPRGRLILSVPFMYGLHEQPYDYFRYTEFGLRRLCEQAGLDPDLISPYGGRPDVIIDLLNKWVANRAVARSALLGLAGWVAKSDAFAARRHSSARVFPLGYNVVAAKPG